jgi:phenylacetate-coenzyme A ligase PaaK-like adenylate-forming protein
MTTSSEAVRRRLAQLFERSPFWRDRWRASGFVRAPEDLDGLAPVVIEDLAADERAHPPYGTWRAASEFVRVGVPARPSALEMLVFTPADLELEARVGALALSTVGLAPGGRETNTLPGGLATPGSLVVGDAAQALGALDMPVGPISAAAPRDTAFDFWQRVKPDFAVLDAAGAQDLARLLEDKGTTANEIGLRAAVLVSDLRDPLPDAPELGVPVARVVGLAEAFSLLAPCDADGLFSVPSAEVVVEVLEGELVVTTLRHSAALVRYATGVRARLVPPPVGRSEDVAFVLG